MSEDVEVLVAADSIVWIESVGDQLTIKMLEGEPKTWEYVSPCCWCDDPAINYPELVMQQYIDDAKSN